MTRKRNAHLKFTLFPFVSILLAVVGVLLFLTMLQAIFLKTDEPEKKKDENTRIYERIPELKTAQLTFEDQKISIKYEHGYELQFGIKDIQQIYTEIYQNLIQKNMAYAEAESSNREHLLYVVKEDGFQNYMNFTKALRLTFEREKVNGYQQAIEKFMIYPKTVNDQVPLNPYLPVGLCLLRSNEKLEIQ